MTDDNGPPGDGWQLWLHSVGTHPEAFLRAGRVIELWRSEWGHDTCFATSQNMHPGVNVAGLYWRPA